MGSKAPAFSTDATSIAFVRFVHTGFGLLCQAQGFPVPLFRQVNFENYNFLFLNYFCIEPVGAKAPTFSTDSKSSTFVRAIGQSFGLLCQAQSFPVPLFRQVLF